jgi:hypothetical protein
MQPHSPKPKSKHKYKYTTQHSSSHLPPARASHGLEELLKAERHAQLTTALREQCAL